jgi:hypothetical protein
MMTVDQSSALPDIRFMTLDVDAVANDRNTGPRCEGPRSHGTDWLMGELETG